MGFLSLSTYFRYKKSTRAGMCSLTWFSGQLFPGGLAKVDIVLIREATGRGTYSTADKRTGYTTAASYGTAKSAYARADTCATQSAVGLRFATGGEGGYEQQSGNHFGHLHIKSPIIGWFS
jgi:hypothetical protein